MATIRELSMICGVSVSTISKALNGYKDISEETRERVLKAANEIGYFPDANARSLKLRKTCNIGVLFSTLLNHGLRNEYFAHILAAFKERAAKHGYDITFIEHNIGNRKMSYLEHCRYRNFDGIFIACAEFDDPEVMEIVRSDFPVVVVDHAYDDAISILSDNTEGMRQLTQYIIDQGHRKIAYIHGNKSAVTHNRIVSFNMTLRENGITIPSEYFLEGLYRSSEASEVLAMKLLKLPDPPTCIIASDDYAALGVMNTIHRLGLKVPHDISVAGFDGISVSDTIEPKLTTVKQDTNKIGNEAAKQLINLIENPMTTSLDNIYLKTQLIKGASVKNINES